MPPSSGACIAESITPGCTAKSRIGADGPQRCESSTRIVSIWNLVAPYGVGLFTTCQSSASKASECS